MPATITIVGLGPGDSPYWTRAATECLQNAPELYLRTPHHPGIDNLPGTVRFLDGASLVNDDVDAPHQRLAAEVIRLGQRPQGVLYAVPGHPRVDEPAFPAIRDLAAANNIPLTVIPGLSILEAAHTALGLERSHPLQILEAPAIAGLHHPPLAADQAALITHLYHLHLAQKVKNMLRNQYDEQFEVTVVHAAGSDDEKLTVCALENLDQQPIFDERTMLYLPPDEDNHSFVTLQGIIAQLRAPDGCPWDRRQTLQSMRPYILEETYEVLEALDANDKAALAEELGDLLMVILLMVQIAIDDNDFKMGAVLSHISRKMVRRHPHVFGDLSVEDADEVLANWDAIKKAEKSTKGETEQIDSVLNGLPPGLPALAETLNISKRVVRIGFEWPNLEGVLDKLIEEATEIVEATDHADIESEIGDFLFSAVNLARWHNVDPESALRATNARFTRRFQRVEALAAARNRPLPEMPLEEMLALWREAKVIEG